MTVYQRSRTRDHRTWPPGIPAPAIQRNKGTGNKDSGFCWNFQSDLFQLTLSEMPFSIALTRVSKLFTAPKSCYSLSLVLLFPEQSWQIRVNHSATSFDPNITCRPHPKSTSNQICLNEVMLFFLYMFWTHFYCWPTLLNELVWMLMPSTDDKAWKKRVFWFQLVSSSNSNDTVKWNLSLLFKKIGFICAFYLLCFFFVWRAKRTLSQRNQKGTSQIFWNCFWFGCLNHYHPSSLGSLLS